MFLVNLTFRRTDVVKITHLLQYNHLKLKNKKKYDDSKIKENAGVLFWEIQQQFLNKKRFKKCLKCNMNIFSTQNSGFL